MPFPDIGPHFPYTRKSDTYYMVCPSSQDIGGPAVATGDEGYFVPPTKGISQAQVSLLLIVVSCLWSVITCDIV